MKPDERLNIGEGRWLIPVEYSKDDPVRIVGFQEHHPRPDNGWACAGFIWVDGTSGAFIEGGPLWEVAQWEPLTLNGSVLCRACGNHGYIREGRWVPV